MFPSEAGESQMRVDALGCNASPRDRSSRTRADRTSGPKQRRTTMIRKLILSAVFATGAITGLTMTPGTIEAAPPIGHERDRDHDRHRIRYEVQVRHRGHWDTYGTYRNREEARRVVRMLERQ